MKNLNTKGNWKKESVTWNIAMAIVGRGASTKAVRNVQLKIVYPLMIVLWVITVALGSKAMIYMVTTPVVQECTYSECRCYTGYDSFGRYYNNNLVDYHCDIHGHDCPQED